MTSNRFLLQVLSKNLDWKTLDHYVGDLSMNIDLFPPSIELLNCIFELSLI